jgi:Asp/Glu/hydantoin racemase
LKRIGVIHTTPATINSLTTLIKEKIDNIEIVNILDDSILSDMIKQNNLEFVEKRWISYAKTLEELGVHAVLSACSTVGEIAERANTILHIPVYRIDEAMAIKAVEAGKTICVFATLNSTLSPTARLIQRKAIELQKEVVLNTILVDSAYEALLSGNKELHDSLILKSISEHINSADIIVLAQASMAGAVSSSETLDKSRILTSPELGIERLKSNIGCEINGPIR